VRLAGPGPAPAEALALRAAGVVVEPGTDLDADPGPADIAYLDVWTPEVAPRIARLRSAGTRLSCLSDLLLERTAALTLGVTGTAGKTTTASLAVQLLRAAGVAVAASTSARAGNLWAAAELLDELPSLEAPAVLALELTSSHLCFVERSPDVAVVTAFWPDHVELHGSAAAYRAAKEAAVRHQTAEAWVVVNEDDPRAASFAELTPARRASFSLAAPVAQGAFVRGDRAVARWEGVERDLGSIGGLPLAGRARANGLAAVTAALAAGAPLDALPGTLRGLHPPPLRARTVARTADGVTVVDDGMAATPAKAAATLAVYDEGAVLLLAGGDPALHGAPVHASPEERNLLERACDEAARAARAAFLFGPASAELGARLESRGVDVTNAASLQDALAAALAAAAPDDTVLFAPLYPVAQDERDGFAALARRLTGRVRK
jgi:UDP-N-acetylmuramoylalanine--D-glutamate ligase